MAEKCIMSSSQSSLESWMTKQKSCWNTSRSCFKVPVFSVPLQLLPMLDKDNDICLDKDISVTSDLAASSPFRGLTCNTCGLQFQSHEEQQAHFKSNVHLVNVKRKMIGKSAISDKDEIEETVDVPLDEGESSDSSEDEGDANDSGNEEPQDRTGKQSYACSAGSVIKQNSAQRGSTFHVRDVQLPDWEIVLSAGAFPSSSALNGRGWADGDRDGGSKPEPHRVISAQLRVLQSNPICAVFLLRSGRFAGAIFNGTNLLIHKVMRRYTVRAKAGGGQSSHDNKSGKAKSAGAMLRRHGEQALREDVAECLRLWTGHIQSCSLILISAPKTMRGDLFVEEATTGSSSAGGGMVLCKDDARIRNVPFMVARPTLDEAKAVYDRCTSVYFYRVDAEVEAATADPAGLSEELSVPKAPSAVRKERDVSPEPWSLTCAASIKIITACSAGDEEAAMSVIREVAGDGHQLYDVPHPSAQADPAAPTVDSMDLGAVVNMVDSLESMSTALHIAARQGMAHVVYVLLELGASPLSADIRGRTAYFLAKDKDTRDAFRRYRGTEEGQDRWDWSAAGVGAALTEEAERMQKQREKDKEKEKKKRAAQRKKEAKQKEEEETARAQEELQRQQVEELRRAEDAKKNAGLCDNCAAPLFGKLALDLYDKRCCGAACVLALRRKLAADAAMKRFQGAGK